MILTEVPDGDAGTAVTIDYARQLVSDGVQSPIVRGLALRYLKSYRVLTGDKLGEMRAIFEGVLKDFQFRDDPAITTRSLNGEIVAQEGAEMLQPAEGIIASGVGDCDCLNGVLLPSLLGSIGFATRTVTIKSDPSRPDEFSHIYLEAQDPASGEWIALDVARSGPRFGRQPEYFWERREWPMTSAPRFLNGYRGGMGKVLRFRPSVTRFPKRGMGDATDIAMGLEQSTPAILQGIAQVTKAANTPGIAYTGVGFPAAGTTGPGISLSGSSGLILLGVLALIGVAVYSSSRG